MTYVLYFASVLWGLTKKHSRVAEFALMLVSWLLAAFASGNADSGIYEARFNFYQSFEGMSEFGWQSLMILFNKLGVDYQLYRCIIIAFELLLIHFAIHRLTDEPVFILAMYMVFPLCLDIVQMRFALAETIAFFGMSFLFERDTMGHETKHPKLAFVLIVLVSSLFHFITILYLFLLLAPRLGSVTSVIAVPLVSVAFVLITHWSGLANLASTVGLETKYEGLTSSSMSQIGGYAFNIVFYGIAWAVIFLLVNRSRTNASIRRVALVTNWVIAAVVLPLLFISVDFYRIQQGITLLNLAFISRFLSPEEHLAFSRENLLIIFLVLLLSVANLYLYVLDNTNFIYVLLPMFQNNLVLPG